MNNNHIEFNQRKIKKNYRSITGHFPSVKNNRSVAFESKLEKSLFLSLEFDNKVYSYQEQPQIEIFFEGRYKIYSADCYINRDKNSTLKDSLVEVKYTRELEKEKEYFEKKFSAIKSSSNELDLNFEIYTEKNNSEIYLDNLDFLYRYKLNPVKNKYEEQIKSQLINNSLTAFDLYKRITSNPIEYSVVANDIWALVASEKIETDLYSVKLTMNSLLELV